jgi:hypothetical protein
VDAGRQALEREAALGVGDDVGDRLAGDVVDEIELHAGGNVLGLVDATRWTAFAVVSPVFVILMVPVTWSLQLYDGLSNFTEKSNSAPAGRRAGCHWAAFRRRRRHH